MGDGRIKRAFRRLTADPDELAAEQLQGDSESSGATLVADAPPRQRVKVCGVIRGVTLRPVGGVPALEAEVYDGSGTLSVIWLGRRRIAGIDPGVHILVDGRIGDQHGHLTMFNPAYTLQPGNR
jgi:hypothetical protein